VLSTRRCILWSLMGNGPRQLSLFVTQRGWPPKRYEKWLPGSSDNHWDFSGKVNCHETVAVVVENWSELANKRGIKRRNKEEKLTLTFHRNLLILLGKPPLRQIIGK
jgi:hypothetical protein